MKLSTSILFSSAATGASLNQSKVDRMVKSFREAGLYVEQDPIRFMEIAKAIDQVSTSDL